MNLQYTLLADGGSDRALIPIIDWSLKQHTFIQSFDSRWADLGFLYRRPQSLAERVRKAVEIYPCNLLFVHRDAEGESSHFRRVEIENALSQTGIASLPECVPIIPIRMTEAWLLTSEIAIRQAAGNPSGTARLELPRLVSVERHQDPKELLFEKLKIASGRTGRRLARFNVEEARTLVSQFMDDFSSLQVLAGFNQFQASLTAGLERLKRESSAQ